MPAIAKLSTSPQRRRLFTVGEIVDRIGQASNAAAVSERIKVWTRSGLLFPMNKKQKYPGTGHHRRYEWPAVIDAAVLNALTEARVEVVAREDTLFALALAKTAYGEWQQDMTARHYLFLISIRGKPFAGDTALCFRDKIELPTAAEFGGWVSLSPIFARLQLP